MVTCYIRKLFVDRRLPYLQTPAWVVGSGFYKAKNQEH